MQNRKFGSYVSLSAVVTLILLGGFNTVAADDSPSLQSRWPADSTHPFHEALENGLGFSFTYDGKRVGPTGIEDWEVSTKSTENGEATHFRHASGLTLIRESRTFPAFEAIEYSVRFKNDGASELPPLRAINAMDLTFAKGLVPGVSVVSSGGGMQDPTYPPEQFAISRHYLGQVDPMEGRQSLTLTTEEGKPSNKDLPFFFMEHDGSQSGIFVALGWTGQWSVRISADHPNKLLHLRGGIPDLNVRLRPGEEISGPTILVGSYRGPLSAGSNRLRRLMREHYIPKVEGRPLPVVLYDTWFNVQCDFDEQVLRRLADSAAEIGHEYFLLDACWYEGTTADPNWTTWEKVSRSLGNWERPEPDKFPSGLPPVAEYVRSKGMQFGLWFEPERIAKDTQLEKAHPDWVLWREGTSWGLLDFGRPEVQEWAINLLDRYIRELDLRYIRWDFNYDPLRTWDEHDKPDRRGMLQIRHVEGLRRVEDWVRQHHPQLILESCSSGGMRIDLQTLQRRPTIWISDQTVDPRFVRFHLQGLNHFIPGSSQMVALVRPVPYKEVPEVPDIDFQSYFGGAFGSMGRLDQWSPALKKQARQHVNVFKRIRKFLAEDYYLLIPQPRSFGHWEGWQFHNPETGEGFVQVFRNKEAPQALQSVVMMGLAPNSTYRFVDPYTEKSFEVSAAKALSEGLAFNLEPGSSKVLLYQRSK